MLEDHSNEEENDNDHSAITLLATKKSDYDKKHCHVNGIATDTLGEFI